MRKNFLLIPALLLSACAAYNPNNFVAPQGVDEIQASQAIGQCEMYAENMNAPMPSHHNQPTQYTPQGMAIPQNHTLNATNNMMQVAMYRKMKQRRFETCMKSLGFTEKPSSGLF